MANTVTDELVLRYHLLFAVLFWHWGESCFLVGTLRLCDKRLRLHQCPHRFNSSKLEPGGVWKTPTAGLVCKYLSHEFFFYKSVSSCYPSIEMLSFHSLSVCLVNYLIESESQKWVVSLMLSPQKSPLPTPNKVYVFRNRAQQWLRNV